MGVSLTARQLVELLVDPGSHLDWDEPADTEPADAEYRASLARARRRTGLDEAVLTGTGRIGGQTVVLIASEFGFLGGSIGVATAERITRAVERATAERLPVVALPVSGGTRMQEGSAAFLCMLRITAAVQAHRAAGIPSSPICGPRPATPDRSSSTWAATCSPTGATANSTSPCGTPSPAACGRTASPGRRSRPSCATARPTGRPWSSPT
ncbi:carboxyl transferase domain-containing protein [Kitasatospora sp. NPDC001574]